MSRTEEVSEKKKCPRSMDLLGHSRNERISKSLKIIPQKFDHAQLVIVSTGKR